MIMQRRRNYYSRLYKVIGDVGKIFKNEEVVNYVKFCYEVELDEDE